MYILFFIFAFFSGTLQAQPSLTKISSTPYQPYPQEAFERVEKVVKLQGKYYYVTMGLAEPEKKKKKGKNTPETPAVGEKEFTLYETDGTMAGTKIAARNKDGFYQLSATKDALLYYTYTPQYGNLCKYSPAKGPQTLSTQYKLNALERVSRIYTYPDRTDALLGHFENGRYYMLYLSSGGELRETVTAPYIQPDRLNYLDFTTWDRPLLNDTAFFTLGRQRVGTGFALVMRGFRLTEKKGYLHMGPTVLRPKGISLAGDVFFYKDKPAIMYTRMDSATGKFQLGYLYNDQGTNLNLSTFGALQIRATSLNRIEKKEGKILLLLDDFTGLFFTTTGLLQKLNNGIRQPDFFNNDEQTLLAGDQLFFTKGDSLFFQTYTHGESGSKSGIIRHILAPRQTFFPDQSSNKFVQTRGVVTRGYLYYVANDKKLMRVHPYDTQPASPVLLPAGTKIKEWRMFMSCEDALLIGGVTEGENGRDHYEVFMIRDNL
ncbi:MAG: hypothetical protein IAE96_12265 [Chitinophagaceae bacterium]|nr:hypothetical protein [Chitinophagaceae bacterium]